MTEDQRLKAFSDGVIAIIITIMVLELKVPHGEGFAALNPLLPMFFCYVLSFLYVGIYWNNHHHLLHSTPHVSDGILWANLPLLFWLSLFLFATDWVGENHFAPMPTAAYGGVLFLAGEGHRVPDSQTPGDAGTRLVAEGPAAGMRGCRWLRPR